MVCRRICTLIKGTLKKFNRVSHDPFGYVKCSHYNICIPKKNIINLKFCPCYHYKLSQDPYTRKRSNYRRVYLESIGKIKRI